MGKDVIIACDFATTEKLFCFLDNFSEKKPFLKVGMELFYAAGPEVIYRLKERGHKIFLDLKLHDIPNTVKSAMKVLSGLEIDMCNLHASGGIPMMEAALEGLTRPDGSRPMLIAVTQLTSTDQTVMERDLLIREPIGDVILHYAKNAKVAGLDGVVCSPKEARSIHEVCGSDYVTVTPGIRFPESSKDDQKRIMTPAQAKAEGSDYIVVGRPVTGADDVRGAYNRCLEEFI